MPGKNMDIFKKKNLNDSVESFKSGGYNSDADGEDVSGLDNKGQQGANLKRQKSNRTIMQ